MKQKGKVRYPNLISIRIEPELLKALDEWAEEEDRPVGSLVRVILREALEAREGKKGKKKPT